MSTSAKGPARNARPPKLRLSCDACAAAKVKCSREQPDCERCITNGTECVYGPSRRSGKPPRDPNRHSAAANDANKVDSTVSENFQQGQKASYESNQYNLNPQWSNPIPSSLVQWTEPPMHHAAEAYSTSSPFPQMDAAMFGSDAVGFPGDASSGTHWHLDNQGPYGGTSSSMMFPPFDFQDLHASLGAERSGSSSTSASSAALSSDFGAFNPPQAPVQQNTPAQVHQNSCGGRDCYTLAYSTLASLHFQRPYGSMSQSSQDAGSTPQSPPQAGVPSLDSVLCNNKTAIHNVLQLLTCPCAADAHMALLYASITSKILIWYQVAAGITISSSSPTAAVEHAALSEAQSMSNITGAAINSMSTPYSMGSTFADEPVKIGSFSPDEECQAPMRQVLLLGELGKAGVLIEALSQMHGGSNGNSKNSSIVTPTPPARNLYATLGSWLKNELARTTSEVKNGSRMQLGL